jgi:molybdate transport system regulatory protein
MCASRTHPAFKLWLETDDGYVFGPGVYNLLKKIEQKGTLKEATKSLGMSYRFSWGLIKRAEEKLGEPLITATKGGRQGGGSTEITELGRQFVHDFEKLLNSMSEMIKTESTAQITGLIEAVEGNEKGSELKVRIESQVVSLFVNYIKTEIMKGDRVNLTLSLSSERA